MYLARSNLIEPNGCVQLAAIMQADNKTKTDIKLFFAILKGKVTKNFRNFAQRKQQYNENDKGVSFRFRWSGV